MQSFYTAVFTVQILCGNLAHTVYAECEHEPFARHFFAVFDSRQKVIYLFILKPVKTGKVFAGKRVQRRTVRQAERVVKLTRSLFGKPFYIHCVLLREVDYFADNPRTALFVGAENIRTHLFHSRIAVGTDCRFCNVYAGKVVFGSAQYFGYNFVGTAYQHLTAYFYVLSQNIAVIV